MILLLVSFDFEKRQLDLSGVEEEGRAFLARKEVAEATIACYADFARNHPKLRATDPGPRDPIVPAGVGYPALIARAFEDLFRERFPEDDVRVRSLRKETAYSSFPKA